MHGRTRAQGGRGDSDWSKIAAVKKALGIPVIANGGFVRKMVGTLPHAVRCFRFEVGGGRVEVWGLGDRKTTGNVGRCASWCVGLLFRRLLGLVFPSVWVLVIARFFTRTVKFVRGGSGLRVGDQSLTPCTDREFQQQNRFTQGDVDLNPKP